MAYDPPSQQPGGQPPEDRPEETPEQTPPGSTVPIPSASDYPQPSSAGAYTTPMSPSEYPSSQQGGMQPPPGGYGSSAEGSPPSQGGYTPPSQGGYSPGGGYSPPPPPPPMYSGPGMESAATPGQVGLQGLLQSYINAITRPTAATYEAELGNASWLKVFIGVGVVTIVSIVVNLLTAGSTSANLDQSLQPMRDQGFDESTIQAYKQVIEFLSSGGGLLGDLLLTGIFFFLGAAVMYICAKVLGGSGSDFMTHAYLLSLSYTPLRLVLTPVGALSGLGANSAFACVGLLVVVALYGYMIYSAGVSMRVSQRLAPGRAQLAAFLPAILVFLLACLCVIGLIALLIGQAGNLSR